MTLLFFIFLFFSHPDPSVKRQSGFLYPKFQNSNNSGQSIQIPYYKVISDNKDLTISPRIFFDNKILVQNEYRQINKFSSIISDFSIYKDNKETKNHFLTKLEKSGNLNHSLNLQVINGDKYLKQEKIKSS